MLQSGLLRVSYKLVTSHPWPCPRLPHIYSKRLAYANMDVMKRSPGLNMYVMDLAHLGKISKDHYSHPVQDYPYEQNRDLERLDDAEEHPPPRWKAIS